MYYEINYINYTKRKITPLTFFAVLFILCASSNSTLVVSCHISSAFLTILTSLYTLSLKTFICWASHV